MVTSASYSFIGGDRGDWEVTSVSRVIGEILEPTPYFEVRNEYLMNLPVDFRWVLRGVTGVRRWAGDGSQAQKLTPQPRMGRVGATCAAFIPVKKRKEWWDMEREERGKILGEKSRGVTDGLAGSAGIAGQLHHSRDLGEPFDFLTWFEYEPGESGAFEEMVARMRSTEEWKYVEREVDVRLVIRK